MGQGEYSVKYHYLVFDEVARPDSFWRRQILLVIENKLLIQPQLFGKPLRQTLKGYRSLRVGDYRVVYRIEKKVVKIVAIVHRSSKYRGIEKRI